MAAAERRGNNEKGLKGFHLKGLSPESQGQNLFLTVLHAPNCLDSGWG